MTSPLPPAEQPRRAIDRVRRRRPPEVLQTSGMDCGPASLAAGCRALGLDVRLDALREVCGSDVDGTSVDAMEEVANGLGLVAEQVVIPTGHLLAAPERYLPALAVTRLPDGFTHLVFIWECTRGAFTIMDPAVGWRRVRARDLAGELYAHPYEAPAEDVAAYVESQEFTAPLAARLVALGLADTPRATTDELARAESLASSIERLRAARAVRRAEIPRVARALLDTPRALETAPAVGPPLPGPDGDTRVLTGAILITLARPPEPVAPREDLAFVVEHRPGPMAVLGDLYRVRTGLWALALAASVAMGVAMVAQFFVAERLLRPQGNRADITRLVVVLAASVAALVICAVAGSTAARRAEREMRARVLARAPRLGDVYSRTRPTGDLAERAHALQHLGMLADLARTGGIRVGQLAASWVALALLVPFGWLWGLLVSASAAIALAISPALVAEPDLRARTGRGLLAQLARDLVGAAPALGRAGGAPAVQALADDMLDTWRVAVGRVVNRLGAIGVAGGLLAGALAGAVAASGGLDREHAPRTLVATTIALMASTASIELVLLLRQALTVRSTLVRITDPLLAATPDLPTPASPPHPRAPDIALEDVRCLLGGRAVLDGVTLHLAPGEHVAVVGASGAGKSSLIMLLAGWLTPTGGRMLVDGRPAGAAIVASLRARTAWVDPTTALPDEGRAGLRSAGELQEERLARAAGRTGVGLVLLDEAFTGLDPERRARRLADARGRWSRATLVHVTHVAAEAMAFPRVLVVSGGRIVADGTPAALAARPDSALSHLLTAEAEVAGRLRRSGSWRRLPLQTP